MDVNTVKNDAQIQTANLELNKLIVFFSKVNKAQDPALNLLVEALESIGDHLNFKWNCHTINSIITDDFVKSLMTASNSLRMRIGISDRRIRIAWIFLSLNLISLAVSLSLMMILHNPAGTILLIVSLFLLVIFSYLLIKELIRRKNNIAKIQTKMPGFGLCSSLTKKKIETKNLDSWVGNNMNNKLYFWKDSTSNNHKDSTSENKKEFDSSYKCSHVNFPKKNWAFFSQLPRELESWSNKVNEQN